MQGHHTACTFPKRLIPVMVARTQFVDVPVDASDVPSDYILAILGQCTTFPRVLTFFLKGKLTVSCRLLFVIVLPQRCHQRDGG
jgi:hypothetical protein